MIPVRLELEPLVAAAAQGDRDAFGRLVDATSGVVASISLAILGDLDQSRDVAQDVFLAAWRDLGKLRRPASFLPWLRQLTRNRAHHVLRTHLRTRRRAVSPTEELLESVADPRPDASERIVAREDAEALAEALSLLPDDTREVLTLFYREGQSVAQVSALLDLTEAAVKKRLSRARQSLRESLVDRVGDTLRSTAPGAGFTAAVLASLSIAGPASASAATLAASKAIVKAGLLGKVLVFVGSALPGIAAGVAGMLYSARGLLRQARDDEERRGLRLYRAIGSVLVVLSAIAMPFSFMLPGSRVGPIVAFAAFVASLAWLHHVFVPRVIRRRLEAEMREDPVRAVAQRRRERRVAILGWVLGLTFGTAGLLYGLWMTRGH